jgi:hypothetical protein
MIDERLYQLELTEHMTEGADGVRHYTLDLTQVIGSYDCDDEEFATAGRTMAGVLARIMLGLLQLKEGGVLRCGVIDHDEVVTSQWPGEWAPGIRLYVREANLEDVRERVERLIEQVLAQ